MTASGGVSDDLTRLIGKRIVLAETVMDGKWIRLTFEDGESCKFMGLGYDGLWDDVIVVWAAAS